MSEQISASPAVGEGMDKLNHFTDELQDWYAKGNPPLMASRELRYVLEKQNSRLASRGLSMEETIAHTGEEVTGRLARRGEGLDASVLYREAVRNRFIRKGEKVLKKEKEPILFYATLLEKPGTQDLSCTCPNCGHTEPISKMENGCPYCGTVFEIKDVWPSFSSWYTVPGIVERAALTTKIQKTFPAIFTGAFALLTVMTWLINKDYPIFARLLTSVFMGLITAGMFTFVCYMLYSLLLLVKMFREAGRAVPLLKGIKTKNKVEEVMKELEPDFSYSYFEGRILSLLRAIAFTDDRRNLSIYEGNEDLSFLDTIIDMQYRGSIQLLSSQVKDEVVGLKLRVFMDILRYDGTGVKRRDESFIVSVEKDIDARPGYDFDLCSVKCKNCGASFDALHMKTCPYCNTPYELLHDDWMITSITKA